MLWAVILSVATALKVSNKTVHPEQQMKRMDVDKMREEIRQKRLDLYERISEQMNPEQDDEANPEKNPSQWPEPKLNEFSDFNITWFSPSEVNAAGGQYVLMNVVPDIGSTVFCRFNHQVIAGWVTVNGSISCRVPKIRRGEVLLAVSSDRTKWTSPITLHAIGEASNLKLYIFAGVVVVVLYLSRNKMFRKRKNRRKTVESDGMTSRRPSFNEDFERPPDGGVYKRMRQVDY